EPVGSGPFRLTLLESERAWLEAWAPTDENPAPSDPEGSGGLAGEVVGGQPRPYLPGIKLRFFADREALEAAWLAGDLDAVSGLNPVDLADLAGRSTGAHLAQYAGTT